jgi:hypothetical protein
MVARTTSNKTWALFKPMPLRTWNKIISLFVISLCREIFTDFKIPPIVGMTVNQ